MDDAKREPDDTAVGWALRYIERGAWPIPLEHRGKAAVNERWTGLRISAEEAPARFEGTVGVGLLAGVKPKNLVDIDLDTTEASIAARLVMTPTGWRGGRRSRPESHRWYEVDPLPEKTRVRFVDPLLPKDRKDRLLLEIRSTGHQTAVVPSIHPSGEALVWHEFTEAARLSAEDLVREAGRVAFVALLARHWHEWGGQHHDLVLALAGGMIRGGIGAEVVERLVEAVCQLGHDREPEDRLRAVQDTAHQLDGGGAKVTGWPTVEGIVGPEAAKALREWLGIAAVYADDRPGVEVVEDLAKVSDTAWDGLRQANDPPALFRRSNRPLRVERIDDTDTVVLVQLNDVLLRHHLADLLWWHIWTKAGPVTVKPPIDVVRNMLAEEDIPLPVLNRVVTVPVFAPDGTLQTEPGYHPEAKVYYEPPVGLTVPAVAARPTPLDVERARALLLDELLADFPFVGEADRAHAVALALLPFVRDLIEGPTPLHLFEAAKQGTGKGLLVKVLTTLSTGGEGASETPLSTSEEEVRKNLFSMLLEGRAFILLDNLTGTISSAALSVALTSMTYSDRKLGVSETPHVAVRCGWAATANNADLDADLTRRTVRARMVSEVENPHLRPATDFRHPDLLDWVASNRGELIWSVLTLVQAWLADGRPPGERRLGSYEAWSRVVGGILDNAGVPGFLTNLGEFYAEANQVGAGWRAFVEAWWERFGPEARTASELLWTAKEAGFTFKDYQDDKQRAELGTMLRGQKDNVYAGFAIRQGKDRKTKANNYRLEPREGQAWATPAPAKNTAPSVGAPLATV